jgi:EpsG family
LENLIPVKSYTAVFYYFLLVLVLLVQLQTSKSDILDKKNLNFLNSLGYFCLVIIVFYIGFRPLSGKYFGDMVQYTRDFLLYVDGGSIIGNRDVLFQYFMKFCSGIMSIDFFFLLCAFIFVYGHILVSKNFFKDYWFYSFLMFLVSLTFWGSSVNGIRNGLASVFFLIAISQKSKYSIYILMLLSVMIHKSLMLPVAAYFLAFFYKNSKNYLLFWLFSIPLSLALGGFFEGLFLGLGFGEEERLEGYFTELDEGIANSKLGFRWDFILYSATGVFAGWYYIFKKKYNDLIYSQLFNMYLIANAFWILIIRANFSNRFAYLSWFMLPLIVMYPILKNEIFIKQHQLIGKIIFGYFLFTFVLIVILGS